jgi:hypothetical protein
LVNAGFLLDVTEADDGLDGANDEVARRWQPTPAVRIWRIKLNASVSTNAAPGDRPVANSVDEAHLSLFDGREGDT